MEIHVTARHIHLTDEENQAAIDSAQHFTKYFEPIIRVDAVLTETAGVKECEYHVKVQGQTLIAKDSGSDFTKSVHNSSVKIHRQLEKLKTKRDDVRSTLST
ncbi:MAG: ribosome-associated translation inhibitor RaiA [Ignavibacteria bacterium]|nr:ribosome-associated translation inhibitor RaiA [Ignavibacteria bacterium]